MKKDFLCKLSHCISQVSNIPSQVDQGYINQYSKTQFHYMCGFWTHNASMDYVIIRRTTRN